MATGRNSSFGAPRVVDQVKLHDYFNLVAISALVAANICYLYTGTGFDMFWKMSIVYFLVDTLFIGIFPRSIKSPVVILSHHCVTSLFMMLPYKYPEYEHLMAYCMLVEFNTLLLIARRNFYSRALDVLFYASWLLLRCLWYPYLTVLFYEKWQEQTQRVGTPWNLILLAPIFQVFFVALNFMWTYTLVDKLLRGREGKGAKRAVAMSCSKHQQARKKVEDSRDRCL